jgi:hypothetical protein
MGSGDIVAGSVEGALVSAIEIEEIFSIRGA